MTTGSAPISVCGNTTPICTRTTLVPRAGQPADGIALTASSTGYPGLAGCNSTSRSPGAFCARARATNGSASAVTAPEIT